MVLALTGFLWLPHNAKSAWFLNPEERIWAEERIQLDREDPAMQARSSWNEGEVTDMAYGSQIEETHGLLREQSDHSADSARGRLITEDRGLSTDDIIRLEALVSASL